MPLGLLGVLFLLGGLLVSIALHELGHFLTARRFNAKVTQFMVGFGPTLWSRKRGETEYGIKALPLGGFIRIVGMIPPVGQAGGEVARAAREHAAEESTSAGDRAFWRLSPGKRFIVMTAGPVMNLLIWLVLTLTLFLVVGVPSISRAVAQVAPCVPSVTTEGSGACADPDVPSPASAAGITAGDVVVSVAGESVDSWEAASERFRALTPGVPTPIEVARDGLVRVVEVTPVASPYVPGAAYVGVSASPELARLSPEDAAASMGGQLAQTGQAIVAFPGRLFTTLSSSLAGEERPTDGPIGLVGMGRIGGEVAAAAEIPAEFRWVQLVAILAGLNLALFAFNMIPLLPLDGGHAAAAVWEAIRRRWAAVRGQPDPGPVDMARTLPLTYAVAMVFITATLMLVLVDIVNPVRLFG